MAAIYAPGTGAVPSSPYGTVSLSQRDLGLAVPINYITYPAIALTRACFSDNQYVDEKAGLCISNLLASGFRRLEIDIFWDETRRVWSLCPVKIPTSVAGISAVAAPASSSTAAPASSGPRPTASLAAGTLASLNARQESISLSTTASESGSTTSLLSNATSIVASSTSISPTPTVATLPSGTGDEPEVQIGPYTCTASINLSILTSLILDYFQPSNTQNNLGAHLISFTLNLHAASAATQPMGPAPEPTSFPQSVNLLGNFFAGNLSAYLYTPSDLATDRANLNNSFYRVSEYWRPANEYYSTSADSNGIVSTRSGWPSEYYIEFILGKRLLLEFGTIDPQMSRYSTASDANTIFSPDYIGRTQTDVAAAADGGITAGCFIISTAGNLSIANLNNSWATIGNVPSFPYDTASLKNLDDLAGNLTRCGISPILNVTLNGTSADEGIIPYQNWSLATVWSWQPGQPRNYSGESDSSTEGLFRCATTDQQSGRWSVADCATKRTAACRADNQPYNWTITSYQISYSFADQACPDGYQFAAPRTALENAYLTSALIATSRDDMSAGIYVDFNSLSYPGCWVVGSNATCPYDQSDQVLTREVVVPAVAALIVLIITGLTVFAKAAGNRKIRKRTKRRADNGFIYEGIPS